MSHCHVCPEKTTLYYYCEWQFKIRIGSGSTTNSMWCSPHWTAINCSWSRCPPFFLPHAHRRHCRSLRTSTTTRPVLENEAISLTLNAPWEIPSMDEDFMINDTCLCVWSRHCIPIRNKQLLILGSKWNLFYRIHPFHLSPVDSWGPNLLARILCTI